MTVVPHFILKRLYQAGSLRNESDSILFDFKNIVGPGHIIQVNEVEISDTTYGTSQLSLIKNGETVDTKSITSINPYKVMLNDRVSVKITSLQLPPGHYELILDVVTAEAGHIRATFQDTLT